MSKSSSIIVGLLVLIISALFYFWMVSSPPKARKKPPVDESISVNTQVIATRDYTIKIKSYGRIQARTQSQLNAEVSGRVRWINPNLREGSQLHKGDVLAHIDSSDYRAQINMSQANVIQAKLNFQQELARSKQAQINWQRLQLDREPTDLVLRKPQLAAAQAAWNAAKAQLAVAKNDLSRTRIRAPYTAWVLKKYIDIGQVVNTGTALADIYNDDFLEIRLPLALDDLKLIHLPEDLNSIKDYPKAVVLNQLGGDEQPWSATIIRSDAAIDEKTQQLYVTARIEKPIQNNNTTIVRRFKLNQYADAYIEAKTIKNAVVIPNQAIAQAKRIFIVDQQSRAQPREVVVAWYDDDVSIIQSGLQAGEELILTPLGDFAQGRLIKRIDTKTLNDPALSKIPKNLMPPKKNSANEKHFNKPISQLHNTTHSVTNSPFEQSLHVKDTTR